MSVHDTTHHELNEEPRSKTSFVASFWFVIILVGLFIAALNFINVMGNNEEAPSGGHVNKEATSNGTLKGESGLGKPDPQSEQHQTGESTAADTTSAEHAHN